MADLDCKTCDEENQRWRGCGRAPRFPTLNADTGGYEELVWSPTTFFRLCEEAEFAPDDMAASEWWEWGGVGGSVELLAEPWACCPRAWLRTDMVDPDAADVARHALKLARWKDSGSLSHFTRALLTPGMVNLVEIAERAFARQTRLRFEESKPQEGAS